MSPKTIAPMPAAESTTPSTSSPGGVRSSLVSGTYRTIPASTSRPIGTLSQKAHRHDKLVVSQPPPRDRPRPCHRSSTPHREGDGTLTPAVQGVHCGEGRRQDHGGTDLLHEPGRRSVPRRSPGPRHCARDDEDRHADTEQSTPPVEVLDATYREQQSGEISEYPAFIHSACVEVKPMSVMIAGSATLTIVALMMMRETPTATVARAHQRPAGARVGGVGALRTP